MEIHSFFPFFVTNTSWVSLCARGNVHRSPESARRWGGHTGFLGHGFRRGRGAETRSFTRLCFSELELFGSEGIPGLSSRKSLMVSTWSHTRRALNVARHSTRRGQLEWERTTALVFKSVFIVLWLLNAWFGSGRFYRVLNFCVFKMFFVVVVVVVIKTWPGSSPKVGPSRGQTLLAELAVWVLPGSSPCQAFESHSVTAVASERLFAVGLSCGPLREASLRLRFADIFRRGQKESGAH